MELVELVREYERYDDLQNFYVWRLKDEVYFRALNVLRVFTDETEITNFLQDLSVHFEDFLDRFEDDRDCNYNLEFLRFLYDDVFRVKFKKPRDNFDILRVIEKSKEKNRNFIKSVL